MVFVKTVLDIALAEKGYHEKASNAQLDDKTANSGNKNYTKYARDLFAAGYYNGGSNYQAKCQNFFHGFHLNLLSSKESFDVFG